jgi:hypothetical protein
VWVASSANRTSVLMPPSAIAPSPRSRSQPSRSGFP